MGELRFYSLAWNYPLRQEKQPSNQHLLQVAEALEPVLHAAGRVILEIYHQPDHVVQTKADQSPVTEADLESHDLLLKALRDITPEWPVISEEDSASHTAGLDGGPSQYASPFWLIDPLDGTREFIGRTGEFSINLGLVVEGQAFFGMLYGPLQGLLYRGGGPISAQRKTREDNTWQDIHCRRRPANGGVLISSRRSAATPEGEQFARRDHLGSALKFGRIAEGNADLYLRRGPTMEWDTCAGQAIVEAAGGQVLSLSGIRLGYGKPQWRNGGFTASGLY